MIPRRTFPAARRIVTPGKGRDTAGRCAFHFKAPGSRGNVGRFIRVMDDGWYRAPLRWPSYGFINLEGTTQFRLRFDLDDNDNGRADYLSLFSGNAFAPADRPQLIVEYYIP